MHEYRPERLKTSKWSHIPFVSIAKQQPVLFTGACVSVLAMTAMFANALWFQPGPHPSPLFSTRNVDNVTKTKAVAKAKANKEKTSRVAAAELETTKELLREVQAALSVRGYYAGKVDGLYGEQTKTAISTFQSDNDLGSDGKASVRLLTQVLLSASARPQAVPVPNLRTAALVAPTKPETQANVEQPAEPQADGLVARIQSGLKAYGYDDLKVDGRMGQQTSTAIQRFQLDYGMKITGEASEILLKKLRDIGAYKQG